VLDTGIHISDGNSTTSADEGVHSDCTDASSNHSDGSVVSSAREIERREFDAFNSSADDTWQYAYEESMKNRVQIAPPYDLMPMTIGRVPAMHQNQAFAVPQLVTPTLYNEPNETDEEEILPVRFSGHKRASAHDSEAKYLPLQMPAYPPGNQHQPQRPDEWGASNINRNSATMGMYEF